MTRYEDLREFIEQVEALGALRRVEGADPLYEVGGITEVAAGSPECPALLFDPLKGFPPGFRIFTNATVSAQRAALVVDELAAVDEVSAGLRDHDLELVARRRGRNLDGRLGQLQADLGLAHERRRDHEKQHEDEQHVDERDYVDLRLFS